MPLVSTFGVPTGEGFSALGMLEVVTGFGAGGCSVSAAGVSGLSAVGEAVGIAAAGTDPAEEGVSVRRPRILGHKRIPKSMTAATAMGRT